MTCCLSPAYIILLTLYSINSIYSNWQLQQLQSQHSHINNKTNTANTPVDMTSQITAVVKIKEQSVDAYAEIFLSLCFVHNWIVIDVR